MELARRLGHDVVLGRDVEHGGLDVAAQQRGRAHLGARHVADLAELDALLLLDDPGERLGRRASGVHGEGLAVERLPVGVGGLVDHGEEAQALELAEDPQRSAGALDQAVRRAEPDVGLAADHGLVGEVLVGELDQLDVGAPLAHPLHGDEEGERLDRLDVAESDPDAAAAAFRAPARVVIVAARRESPAPASQRVPTPSSCRSSRSVPGTRREHIRYVLTRAVAVSDEGP